MSHSIHSIYHGRNRGYTAMHERERRDQAAGSRYQGKQGFSQYSFQSNRFNSKRPFFSNPPANAPFLPRPPPTGAGSSFSPAGNSNFFRPPAPNNQQSDQARPWINREQQGSNQNRNASGPSYRPPMQSLTPAAVNARQPYPSRMNESRQPPMPIRAYHATPKPITERSGPYEPDEWYAYQAYIDDYYNTNNAYWQERTYANEDS